MFLRQNGIMNHFHTVWTGLELVCKGSCYGGHHTKQLYYTSVTYQRVSASSATENCSSSQSSIWEYKTAHIRKRIAKPRVTESKNFQLLLMTFDIQQRCIVPLLLASSFSHLKVVVYCFGIWSFFWFPLSFTDLNYKSRKRKIGPIRSQVINWCVFFSDLFYVPCQAIDENCINSSMKDLPPGKVCR